MFGTSARLSAASACSLETSCIFCDKKPLFQTVLDTDLAVQECSQRLQALHLALKMENDCSVARNCCLPAYGDCLHLTLSLSPFYLNSTHFLVTAPQNSVL